MDVAGSSFSYYDGSNFVLGEAKFSDDSLASIIEEMALCEVVQIDTLHITSWDLDHCTAYCLEYIMTQFKPRLIQYPGYIAESQNYIDCMKLIREYETVYVDNENTATCTAITPKYISLLGNKLNEYRDILYHPKYFLDKDNDNSTVKFFRKGMFNLLSVGDIEHENLAARVRRAKEIQKTTDVLILAHHGADCPTNSKSFFERVRPTIAICTSNRGNQHEHPRQVVCNRLRDLGIELVTTKDGDVLIESILTHRKYYTVKYYCKPDETWVVVGTFEAKKFEILELNQDSYRNQRMGRRYRR